MTPYNSKGQYLISTKNTQSGNIINEDYVELTTLFFFEKDAIKVKNKIKEVVTKNNHIYKVYYGNTMLKWNVQYKKWCNGHKYGKSYILQLELL